MREISNLELKVKLTNEYLRNGGIEKIFDIQLLDDIINTKFNENGEVDPNTISSRLNAFMNVILYSQTLPPVNLENKTSEYSSLIQKSLFFDQINIETEKEVDALFEKYENQSEIIFRGQREAKWRLYSSLQRYWNWDKLNENENHLEFLKKIINAGKENYSKEIESVLNENHIDVLNDIAILGFLQHHDCPTPLLDWTYDFKISMFFAIDGLEKNNVVKEIGDYFSVYFIEENDFQAGSVQSILDEGLSETGENKKLELIDLVAKDENQKKEMIEHFKERSYIDRNRVTGSGLISHMTKIEHMINIPLSYFSDKNITSGIAFSLINSNNIANQNGAFTWNSHISKPIEVIGNEQFLENDTEYEPNDYRFCSCYNINKKLENYIREKLDKLGITKEFIYPDIEHINTNHIYQSSRKAISYQRFQ
jgi:hypothetical protein